MKTLVKNLAWAALIALVNLSLLVPPSVADDENSSEQTQNDFVYDSSLSESAQTEDSSENILTETKPTDKPADLNLRLNSPISPYLGVEKSSPGQPETGAQSPKSPEELSLGNYNLETGVGVRINKHSEFNLGYRMKELDPLSKDQYEAESLMSNGDVRFSLDIKLPF